MMLPGFLALLLLKASAFQSPPTRPLSGSAQSTAPNLQRLTQFEPRSSLPIGPLYFWGKNKDEEGEETPAGDDEKEGKGGEESGKLPFFGALRRSLQPKSENTEGEQGGGIATAEPTKVSPPRKTAQVEEDPVANAQSLRAQAERIRLEAERMDAELTLRKIARLEKELAGAVAKDDTENIEKIQREMDALQARMRGESPKPAVPPKKENSAQAVMDDVQAAMDEVMGSSSIDESISANQDYVGNFIGEIDPEDIEETAKMLKEAPGFIKKVTAQMVEIDFDATGDINCTAVAVRLNQIQNGDFSFSKLPKPNFSQAQIEEAKREIKNDPGLLGFQELMQNTKGKNDTENALLYLNYGYYVEKYMDNFLDESSLTKLAEGDEWLKGVIDAVNQTAVDSSIENIYPKCTRKEGGTLPTLANVQTLMSDVLPKASFTPRGKPEQVLGGFVIRGSSRYEKGEAILNAIEEQMAKSNLKDKMTVLVSKDFTLLAQLDEGADPDNEPPILYVMGPDILPERKRIPLALTSALGIASCWYLSIYPFLLNPAVMKRTEEQLALADASMAYDLSWLTELALPLFFTFVGIQVVNESGKRVVASLNEVELTLPTLVPSLVTGITSSVTTFKTLPKNKEALFDISFAGPFAGVLASLAALVIGSQLTLSSDPSLLPALPLEILRQSTLGGGIIDAILGAGALGVPEGAAGSQAVAGMTVSLHPVAVAGYIGLILNALALLPIGTTDGGRIALALYGRGAKLLVGNIMLSTMFLVGLQGSDLFLFYFAFVIAFQTGNEIPARNEVDNISFIRVCLAIGSTVVALLTLIPFQ